MTTNRTALVTGAAGAIGAAFVSRLVGADYLVTAVDISRTRLDVLESEFPVISTCVADVSRPGGADAAVAAAGGTVDALFNVAGMGDGLHAIDETDDDLWSRVIAANQTSVFLLMQRVIPYMKKQRNGVIINLSSVAGLRGGRAGVAYTASKWAVVGMTQNVAATLGPAGVRCHAICPSSIAGAITLGDGAYSEEGRRRSARDAGKPAPGQPSDVAELGMFLISGAAKHLNGLTIPVDAGWLAY